MTKKIPSFTTTNAYDINIINDYVRLERLINSKAIILKGVTKKEYLDSYKAHLEAFCEQNEYDFEAYFGPKFPIIVDSTTYAFEQHLGHCLVSYEINKISALLDYQYATYKGKSHFPSIVEHGTYDCVKRLSRFNNNARLKEIMKWVNAHRKFIQNPEMAKTPKQQTLMWVSGDKKKLKQLSRKIWKNKSTDLELDFYRAISEGSTVRWNSSPELLSHLIYTLVERKFLKSKINKGHFKATQRLFDYGQTPNSKIRLSEISSRINKDITKNPAKRKLERNFVSKVIYSL